MLLLPTITLFVFSMFSCTISQSITLEVYARGFDQPQTPLGWYSVILLNGGTNLAKPADVNHPIGHTIVLVNERTGSLMDVIRFDTYYNSSADNLMINYLNSITSIHTIVAIVTFDSQKYCSNTHALLQTWGCNQGVPGHRESFLFIGTPSTTYNPSWQICMLSNITANPPYADVTIPLFETSNPTINPTNIPTKTPTTINPTTSMPTTINPTTSNPTTLQPTIRAPTTFMPSTAIPTTAIPTTFAPTSAIPTTVMPTTVMPTTDTPTTLAPTTSIPTTSTTTYRSTTTVYTDGTVTEEPTKTPIEDGSVVEYTSEAPNEYSSNEDELATNNRKQNNTLIYIIVAMGFLLCFCFFLVFIYKKRKGKENTNKEQKHMEMELAIHTPNTTNINITSQNNIQVLTPSNNGQNGGFGLNLTNGVGVNNVLMNDIVNEMNDGTVVTPGGPTIDSTGDGTVTNSTGNSDDEILIGNETLGGPNDYNMNENTAHEGNNDDEYDEQYMETLGNDNENLNLEKDEFVIGGVENETDNGYVYDSHGDSDDNQILECINTTRM